MPGTATTTMEMLNSHHHCPEHPHAQSGGIRDQNPLINYSIPMDEMRYKSWELMSWFCLRIPFSATAIHSFAQTPTRRQRIHKAGDKTTGRDSN
jgi:hypothetical protein